MELKELLTLAVAVHCERNNIPLSERLKEAMAKATHEEKCEMEIEFIEAEFFCKKVILTKGEK